MTNVIRFARGAGVAGCAAGSLLLGATAGAQGGVEAYCTAGDGGIELSAVGSAELGANGGHGNLELVAQHVPAPQGWFLMGDLQQTPPPFGLGGGGLCVAGSRALLAALSVDAQPEVPLGAGAWTVRHTLDYLEGDPLGAAVWPGSTWNFQFVHRDGDLLATSNALAITFGPPVDRLAWKTVAIGTWSQHPEAGAPGVLVIDDAEQWSAFQLLHFGGLPHAVGPPPADFRSERVLVVFAGEKPSSGYAIEVVELPLSVTTLQLITTTTAPGPGCGVLAVITHPHHIVRVPRVEGMQLGEWTDSQVAPPCR